MQPFHFIRFFSHYCCLFHSFKLIDCQPFIGFIHRMMSDFPLATTHTIVQFICYVQIGVSKLFATYTDTAHFATCFNCSTHIKSIENEIFVITLVKLRMEMQRRTRNRKCDSKYIWIFNNDSRCNLKSGN